MPSSDNMPRTAILFLLGLLLSSLAYALLREAGEEVLEASGEARADSLEQSSSESTEGAALVESEPEEDAVQEIHQVLCLKGRKGMPKHIDSIHIYGYGSPKLGRYRIDSLKVFTQSAHSMMRPGASLDHAYGYYRKNGNPIHFMDLDFDGYEDIAVTTWLSGVSGNTHRMIYLFNPVKGDFTYSEELSNVVSISVDREREMLFSALSGGGGVGVIACYTFRNRTLRKRSEVAQDIVYDSAGLCYMTRTTRHFIEPKPTEHIDTFYDCSIITDPTDFNSLPRSVHLVPMAAYPIEASFEQEVLSLIGVRAEDAVVYASPVSSSKVMVSNLYEGDAYKGVEIWQLEANRAEKLGAIGIYQEVAVGDRSEWEYLPVLDKVYAYESFSGNVYVFFGTMDLVLIKDKKWIRSRGPVTVDVKRWKLEGLDFDI